jgi:hypothetical protein
MYIHIYIYTCLYWHIIGNNHEVHNDDDDEEYVKKEDEEWGSESESSEESDESDEMKLVPDKKVKNKNWMKKKKKISFFGLETIRIYRI